MQNGRGNLASGRKRATPPGNIIRTALHHADSLFGSDRVADSEASAAFGATTSQYFAAIGSRHAFTEAVFVNTLAV